MTFIHLARNYITCNNKCCQLHFMLFRLSHLSVMSVTNDMSGFVAHNLSGLLWSPVETVNFALGRGTDRIFRDTVNIAAVCVISCSR
jgi:hypothetical protein